MFDFTRFFDLIAQAEAAAPAKDAAPSPFGSMLPAIVIVGVLFYFMLIRPQKRDQRKREEQLKNLKKNDVVITIGGIHGVVVGIRPEEDEVTLRVDESTNARLRMTLSSIARVVVDKKDGESGKEGK